MLATPSPRGLAEIHFRMPFSLPWRRILGVATFLIALPALSGAQSGQEFVGRAGFFDRGFMPAVLKVDKLDGSFKATLTFVHFKEAIGAEKVTSTAELEGRYDKKFRRVQLAFKRWIGVPPEREYALGNMNGEFDEATGLLNVGNLQLAVRGTPAAARLEQMQAREDAGVLRQREREEMRMGRTGELERERSRITAREREREVIANPGSIAVRRGSLDAARSPTDRCAVLEQWVARLEQEYRLPARGMNIQSFEMQVNLFRDAHFVPVFGRAYATPLRSGASARSTNGCAPARRSRSSSVLRSAAPAPSGHRRSSPPSRSAAPSASSSPPSSISRRRARSRASPPSAPASGA